MNGTIVSIEAVQPLSVRPKDAAKLLGVTTRTLATWARNGLLKPSKIGGVVLYKVSDLQRFLDDNAKQ